MQQNQWFESTEKYSAAETDGPVETTDPLIISPGFKSNVNTLLAIFPSPFILSNINLASK